jgi:DNA-binding NtrC family response regulator
MRVSPPVAADLALLLVWDSPFLPEPCGVSPLQRGVELELQVPGEPLAAGATWSEARRIAVAAQLAVAAAFLYDQGWLPARGPLRGARVTMGRDGVHLRLGGLPRARLEGRRAGAGGLAERANLAGHAVLRVLASLLPRRRRELEEALRRAAPGEGVDALLAVLQPRGWTAASLRHPAGRGRFLWSRRLALPVEGVVWVEEPELLPRLAAAANLARPDIMVAAGCLDEPAVARAQARATARGAACLVLTTLPVAGSTPLSLDGSGECVWLAPGRRPGALDHVVRAVELGRERASVAAWVLAAGAVSAFARRPTAPARSQGREGMASSGARRVLGLLSAIRVGMSGDEIRLLTGASEAELEELQRLGLARLASGRWHVVRPEEASDPTLLREAIQALPRSSRTRQVAEALSEGRWEGLTAWCDKRLNEGREADVLELVRALPERSPLALLGTEAALAAGHLGEARRLLDACPAEARGTRWQALRAWWAERTEQPALAREALERVDEEELPTRLAVRRLLTCAELAHADQDHTTERELLGMALELGGRVPEAELLLAVLDGPAAIRVLRRRRVATWTPDEKAFALHLLAILAIDRGAASAAATALRAALRAASGENPLLLGLLYADLAVVQIWQDRVIVGERFLRLAEGALERAGADHRLATVRHNRAVLANDRLQWRQARELLAANAALARRPSRDIALNRMEMARTMLVRGEWEALAERLPALDEVAASHAGVLFLTEALHSLRAFLALAEGDVAGAAEAGTGAEAETRPLFAAVAAAADGRDPPVDLPERWGMAATARVLAAWRRGDRRGARARAEEAMSRAPLEAAVALARILAVLRRSGEELDDALADLLHDAERTLAADGLDGWAERMRRMSGHHLPRVVRALKGLVLAGTDCTSPAHLSELCGSLGVGWLEVRRGGAAAATWGDHDGSPGEAVSLGGVVVRWGGPDDEAVREVMTLLAGYVASQPAVVPSSPVEGSSLLGRSEAMAAVRELIGRWAPLPIRVLITGEPGTGKELVARELHRLSGRRGAFVAVNCAGIPATLLERELFGSVRGAYSGAEDREGLVEAAEGGTLLLDEIGEMPMEMQAKVLRLLQDREVRRVGSTRSRTVDVRFVAATNRDLRAAVTAGRFRADLYYRVAVALIHMPPLRERLEDIDDLAPLITRRCSAEYDRPGVTLAPATLAAMRRWSWPGNVRELKGAIQNAVSLARPRETLGPNRFSMLPAAGEEEAPQESFAEAKRLFERRFFARLLRVTGGNRSEAARRAGLTRQALLYHLRHLGKLDEGDD